ncbi:hypothetical protein PPYR_10698 [Photinus pyralis]|uniref:Uncharacterized protein n=2 Tax=Photinus pyralis TaxID=7054 RepID=A0A5N4A2S9_PHOPY|nr:zinc finger protein on ecdysone puffs-like isoform X2 [Photinus pyralis]XP_031346550.1 zinc finger protein on ecdysone puffs-like isoform X2 [Photinus pyralis]KAB0791644.1 hypothetical protein PPYR_03444 [Photinus pyralis]KAB0796637.1 hypothetical protein PPYR_10698 [Photinus pyralis]
MSYYRPSQAVAMTRGRGFSSSYRGSGRSSWGGPSDRGRGGYGSSRGRFPPYSSTIESRSKYSTSGDRYTSSSRGYDDYHKSYRGELSSGGYPGRDGARSPERKRLRPEAASSRRSHEGDSFNSSSGRYPSNSFSERRSFSRDRRPPSYSTGRDEFRRPTRPISSTPRGGYRGRISTRGMRGAHLRAVPPRRRLIESSYAIRKRLPPRLTTSDYARRLKISRLRSAISHHVIRKHDDDEEEDESDKEESEEKDDKEEIDGSKKEDEEMENGEDGKDEDSKEKKDSPKKVKKELSDSKNESEIEKKRKDFIKLACPHCNIRCVTFNKYSIHLHSGRHMTAMRYVAMKQKSILARMRLTQRNAQRELEKSTEDLAPRTNFCPLCKLNYKQPKATHQASEAHKSMKKFLMPYCRFCSITFKSPMLYETHICSIEHIKRKARNLNADKPDREDMSGNEEDNLENFMTIDSIGDFDEEEEAKKNEGGEGKSKEKIDVGIEQIRKVEVYYCELCKMYLPRVEEGGLEKNLSKHCKQRTHMQRYIRYKEDKELANHAERLQRKETAEKEREKNKNKEQGEPDKKESKTDEKEKSGEDEENIDDKLWADDVNKDLGDILAEAESGNKSSDEDEDAGGQRYDRLRYSEKDGEVKKDGEPKDEAATEKKTEDKVEEAK